MMKKIKSVILLCFGLCSVNQFSVNAQVAVYMRHDGEITYSADSAAFKRVIYDLDSAQKVFPIVDYFLTGKLKSRRFASSIDPFVFTGQMVEYFENGSKRISGHYEKGELLGLVYRYHQNGKPYSVQEYLPSKMDDKKGKIEFAPIVKSSKDSSGIDVVKDGTGYYVEYDDYNPEIVAAAGNVADGKWEGEVKGTLTAEGLKYNEKYKNGVLISGISVDSLGHEFKYTDAKLQPNYKGGMMPFYQFLMKNLRYPESAARNGIQGKVFVKFLVHPDGTTSDFEVVKLIDPDLAIEALRVVKAAGNWNPATIKGKPVSYLFRMPVNFTLN